MVATTTILLALNAVGPPSARASTAWGSINNFDVVNHTGEICHGFEIEIEDIHSRDITRTYNWNHYGTPKITEDNTDPVHPKVRIRYESAKNADKSWSAYTAIPSGPIDPTNGHRFTDPSLNFGGEHFGVGYRVPAANIVYHWLIDGGSTSGDGVYNNGVLTTVSAAPAKGFAFLNWSENGAVVSQSANYSFDNLVNRSLTANFIAVPTLLPFAPAADSFVLSWSLGFAGWKLQESPDLDPSNWIDSTRPATVVGDRENVTVTPMTGSRYFRLVRP